MRTWLLLAWSLALPWSAAATTLVSQDRSVAADAYFARSFGTPTFDSETVAAADFGPFVQTASAAAGFAGASARQSSKITPQAPGADLLVNATGEASASAFDMMGENALGSASAGSDFQITFALDASMPFELSVRVFGSSLVDPFPAGGAGQMSASVELLDGGGGVLAQLSRSSSPGPPSTFDESAAFFGILAPGTYVLQASAAAEASGSQYNPDFSRGDGYFELSFSIVPEPTPGAFLLVGLAGLAARRHGAARRERVD